VVPSRPEVRLACDDRVVSWLYWEGCWGEDRTEERGGVNPAVLANPVMWSAAVFEGLMRKEEEEEEEEGGPACGRGFISSEENDVMEAVSSSPPTPFSNF